MALQQAFFQKKILYTYILTTKCVFVVTDKLHWDRDIKRRDNI